MTGATWTRRYPVPPAPSCGIPCLAARRFAQTSAALRLALSSPRRKPRSAATLAWTPRRHRGSLAGLPLGAATQTRPDRPALNKQVRAVAAPLIIRAASPRPLQPSVVHHRRPPPVAHRHRLARRHPDTGTGWQAGPAEQAAGPGTLNQPTPGPAAPDPQPRHPVPINRHPRTNDDTLPVPPPFFSRATTGRWSLRTGRARTMT